MNGGKRYVAFFPAPAGRYRFEGVDGNGVETDDLAAAKSQAAEMGPSARVWDDILKKFVWPEQA